MDILLINRGIFYYYYYSVIVILSAWRCYILNLYLLQCLQAQKTRQVCTRELGAVQSSGAATGRGEPEGQTVARGRGVVRSDILLPAGVRLSTETVAEETAALTKRTSWSHRRSKIFPRRRRRRLFVGTKIYCYKKLY